MKANRNMEKDTVEEFYIRRCLVCFELYAVCGLCEHFTYSECALNLRDCPLDREKIIESQIITLNSYANAQGKMKRYSKPQCILRVF